MALVSLALQKRRRPTIVSVTRMVIFKVVKLSVQVYRIKLKQVFYLVSDFNYQITVLRVIPFSNGQMEYSLK
jgi:hypothetical protein